MKIQCDVCSENQASLFCTADEAALCEACDHRVHHANKLASKHLRLCLQHPRAEQFPVCDVCQEKRAFVFCQQDRAILCKDCDFPIHSANDHTKNHTRFLLTGVKLASSSSASTPHPPSSLPPSNPNPNPKSTRTNSSCKAPPQPPLPLPKNNNVAPKQVPEPHGHGGSLVVANEQQGAGFTSSSISEYLTKTIPGWQVDDFLDSPSLPFGFSKDGGDDYMLPMLDAAAGVGGNMMGSFFTGKSTGGIWVPQAPSSVYSAQSGQQREPREVNNIKGSSRSRLLGLGDDNFIVPQMTPATATNTSASKRPRLLW